jgi:hypothetical protein
LSLNNDQIVGFIEQLEKEAKALKEEVIKLCWFMRGSLSYDDALALSQEEREMMSKLIKENLETTKKTGMPFF